MLLASLLILTTFVAVCNAGCYIHYREIPLPNEPAECRDDDGNYHPIKSSWRNSQCEDCFCEKEEIICCNIIPTPVEFDRRRCEPIFHEENCTYSVVNVLIPGKSCPVYHWVF